MADLHPSQRGIYLGILLALGAVSCGSDSVGGDDDGDPGNEPDMGEGIAFDVPVSASARTLVSLAEPRIVTAADDGRRSIDWDLALQGFDVFTNGGTSGPGTGSSFGPLSAPNLLSDTAPDVPFLIVDGPGGAFQRWYAYEGQTHTLFSRFHVYGLRDAENLWKLQVMSYYGEQLGAPVSALYRVRYAPVTAAGVGDTIELVDLDGAATSEAAPSECVDLATGERRLLTREAATTDPGWNLCFRRDAISVNGGLGGPRGTEAVDLDGDATPGEIVEDVKERTAESELPRFDAVDDAALDDPGLSFRPDGIVSAFSSHWLEIGASPPAPNDAVWLVIGADGASRFLVAFDGFDGADAETPGIVKLRVKSVR